MGLRSEFIFILSVYYSRIDIYSQKLLLQEELCCKLGLFSGAMNH